MKKSVRAFGIGLFFAGMCFALLNRFDVLPTDDNSAAYKKEIKELEQQLALLQDETVQEQTEEATKTMEKQATELSTEEKGAPTAASDVQTATVFIYEGMSLYEIGQQIEGEGIVLNGREVELYLARPEYARSIQKGSFDLNSNMTIEEIAKILTGKKID